jgi:hypothetical protein
MLSLHLLKFSDIYMNHGQGAAKKFLPAGLPKSINQTKTVFLWKLKGHVSKKPGKPIQAPRADSGY